MARGWESKDVESQQELREAERRARAEAPVSAEEAERRQKRASLELSRARVAADLDRARHPRHKAQLQAALAHLDGELAGL
ncbi:MAG: hypothetical protein R2762_12000 [Bryobacteraceae bacterium]